MSGVQGGPGPHARLRDVPSARNPAPELSALVDDLEARLRAAGTAARAAGERRYLKSTLTHLGVSLPDTRRIVGAFLDDHAGMDTSARLALVPALWDRRVYELRQAAVTLLERSRDDLDAGALYLLERLIRDAHTWALVDPLAINVTGTIALADPRVWTRTDRWIADDDRWLRRAAVIAHLPAVRADRAAFARFAAHADAVLDEREFFIRKAVGWVLREAGRRHPDLVVAWLEPRIDRASGVTVREAVKYLAADDRDRLLDAYRRR